MTARAGDVGAHPAKRGRDPFHRPGREAPISPEHRLERGRRHEAGEEPHRGTGVAAVEVAIGLLERSSPHRCKLEGVEVEGRGIAVPRGTVPLIGDPRARAPSFEFRSSRRHELRKARGGGGDVEGSGQALESAPTVRRDRHQEPSVGDRLVAGYLHLPGDRPSRRHASPHRGSRQPEGVEAVGRQHVGRMLRCVGGHGEVHGPSPAFG